MEKFAGPTNDIVDAPGEFLRDVVWLLGCCFIKKAQAFVTAEKC